MLFLYLFKYANHQTINLQIYDLFTPSTNISPAKSPQTSLFNKI